MPRHRLRLAGAILLAVALAGAPSTRAAAPPEESGRPSPRRIAPPKRGSLEYRLSWGLAAIRADLAYRRGVDGAGITVAMIDTGLASAPPGLFARLSPASIDLVRDRREPAGDARHGAQTAGVLAAASDGVGSVGVAFGATLLSIRADVDGSCRSECAVRSETLARGIDYALANGARIIGVPLVGPRRLPSVEAALGRAAAAGAVIVAAAGNSGGADPLWPARYAADPRFASAMLVAGASTIDGRPARWSSKARGVESRYLAAPGENVLVDCGPKYCYLVSGTSYSVAYLAGALSLVIAARPELTAQDAARLLLANGRDRGKRGHDAESGTGLVDIARALRSG